MKNTSQFKKEMAAAAAAAGWREKYAMKNGKVKAYSINGERFYKWTYGVENPYQDANGATYNASRGVWVN